MKEIAIIGGGAAGLITSIMIKRELHDLVNVTIFERLEKVGKKILATGNGRCNFTNANLSETKYNDPVFVKPFFKRFGLKETLAFFNELGLLYNVDNNGRYYPISELASSLLDVLRNEARRLGVVEKCGFDVKKISRSKSAMFSIDNTRGISVKADYVVLATGGKASPVLGSNGSGLIMLRDFKMDIESPRVGLVGIKVDPSLIKGLAGIKVNANVSLKNKKTKEVLWSESGEVLFKTDGLSGIVIMQLTSQIMRLTQTKSNNNLYFTLDLLPNLTNDEVADLLINRQKQFAKENNDQLFIGIFHRLLGMNLLRRAKVDLVGVLEYLTNKNISMLKDEIKNMAFDIKGFYDFEKAQITIGGLSTKEVVPLTLETRKVPGLYVCGEILNIDGECGGYNLQWAWTSGVIVAKGIIDSVKNEHGI